MSKYRSAAILFFTALCLLFTTSCGLVVINKNPGGDTDTTGSVSSDTEVSTEAVTDPPELPVVKNDYTSVRDSYLSQIPDTLYTDTVFKITSPDLMGFSPDDSPEYINEAAAQRNTIVEKKHDISLIFSHVESDILFEEVATADKSGMYFADLLMLPQNFIGAFSADDLIINMRSMPSLDFDAEYFSSTSIEAAAGGFRSYGVAGYGSLSPFSLPAVFFNKTLVSSTGADLYSLADSGEWTWDKFFEVSIAAADMTDIFSWATRDLGESVYDAVFVSCGNKMISSGVMKVPSLGFTAESGAVGETILKTLYSADSTIRVNSKSTDYFKSDLGFFQIDSLSALYELSSSKTNWGVLPLPVANAGDSYTSLAPGDSLFFTCPSSVSTPTKSATILMSFNAASVGTLKDSFISYAQFTFLRDNESANMLEYIIDGVVYDFSYTYGNIYPAIADGTFNIVRGAALPQTSLEGLINYYKYSLDSALASRFSLSN